jgi:hypothetical protein
LGEFAVIVWIFQVVATDVIEHKFTDRGGGFQDTIVGGGGRGIQEAGGREAGSRRKEAEAGSGLKVAWDFGRHADCRGGLGYTPGLA